MNKFNFKCSNGVFILSVLMLCMTFTYKESRTYEKYDGRNNEYHGFVMR